MIDISRRKLITTGLTVAGVSGLAAASGIARKFGLLPPDGGGPLGAGETLSYAASRLLTGNAMAREFSRGQISKTPFANEVAAPNAAFKLLQAGNFADWKLEVSGMVARPGTYSIGDMRAMPMKSQITEVVCEEGWSYVGEWIGTPLSNVLRASGVLTEARYVVYYSMEAEYWESIDMADAFHPQTLVTYGMNDGDLPVPFGGPLRLRLPRQLGYKSAKYLTRMVVTDSLKKFGKGVGGVNAEYGYAWWAGI